MIGTSVRTTGPNLNILIYPLLLAVGVSLMLTNQALATGGSGDYRACSKTARVLKSACKFDVADGYLEGYANCLNIGDSDDRAECFGDIRQEWHEGRSECRDIFQARRELCGDIGEAR